MATFSWYIDCDRMRPIKASATQWDCAWRRELCKRAWGCLARLGPASLKVSPLFAAIDLITAAYSQFPSVHLGISYLVAVVGGIKCCEYLRWPIARGVQTNIDSSSKATNQTWFGVAGLEYGINANNVGDYFRFVRAQRSGLSRWDE